MNTQPARSQLTEAATGTHNTAHKQAGLDPQGNGVDRLACLCVDNLSARSYSALSKAASGGGAETLKVRVNREYKIECRAHGCERPAQWIARFVMLAEWWNEPFCAMHSAQVELTHNRLAGLRFLHLYSGRVAEVLPVEIAQPFAVRA